jgi:FKBP-type peptidyl-prolyl cis-trans isomerase
MARTRDRVIALTMAILFFATSVGVSVLVLWQIFADNKEAKTMNQADAANSTLLQGTKLADFAPIAKVDSLQKVDLEIGSGKEVKPGDTVTVDYAGADAATGEIFESSLDAGKQFTTPLSGVIPGWQEGVPGMKEGGKRRLIIPAAQAYGDADLVFDITLHKVEK